MLEKKEPEKSGVINQYLQNKYWFIGSALFFICIASVYLIFTPNKYKVTTSIVLNNKQFPEDAIEDIKSKYIIEKTINQLPPMVSYYHKAFLKKVEVNQDSLPVKFLLLKNNTFNSSTQFTVKALNDQQYEIEQNDTLTDFFFNRFVSYESMKFIGVKGPSFKKEKQPILIKFHSPYQQFEELYDNLDAKFVNDDHNTIELSLTTTSVKNGKDFLNKLVEVYYKFSKITSQLNLPVTVDYSSSIKKLRNELYVLKAKAKKLQGQQTVLLNKERIAAGSKAIKGKESAELSTLNEILPYLKNSVNQFVLIPDVLQVNDHELEPLIAQFNNIESDKQQYLKGYRPNLTKIANFNKQIIAIKQSMLQRINTKRNEIKRNQPSLIVQNSGIVSKSLQDSISKTNNLIKLKRLRYNRLMQNQTKRNLIETRNYKQTIIEKPDNNIITYPKTGYVYLFALLMGLALPLIIPYFKHYVNSKLMERG
jgi:tyrosine-protein kinase Etk/Wzc